MIVCENLEGFTTTEREGISMELRTFGDRLSWARRKHARITQQQLRDRMAEKYSVEIGRNYISQLEGDVGTQPTLNVLAALAGVLRVSLDFLAGLTDSPMPAQGEETTPDYWSAEADEMAQMVDALHPVQRAFVLDVVRHMASPPVQRRHVIAHMRAMLDSVEEELGTDARTRVERNLRRKWLSIDFDS